MEQGYRISDEELKQLQRVELEILIELDRVCRKYEIQYSLDGGTLLGAVRHKGFIPWDDDIDVIMLREEYFKFRKACRRELDHSLFFLQDYRTDPHYRWGYAKLRRNGTELMRPGQEKLKQHSGVYIDLFVADNVPDNPVVRRLHYLLCYLIRKMQYSEVGKDMEKNCVKKGLYRILSKVPRDTIFHIRNWLAARSNRKRTELISHYTFGYPKRCRYGLPRKCFDEMVEMEFEGKRFYGFKDYHSYLFEHYGDYMTLPPKEERVPHLEIERLKLIEPNQEI
jgi:lipopolysaccharide cholinephosphotransferase